MDWNTLKGFEEKYARVTVKEHKTFGGKVVEALYGAQDENGNPVEVKAVGVDGAGRWFGIECNGENKMLIWQHPACDGGALEYGTDRGETALEDMENDIRRKQELCRAADRASTAEELKQIQNEFDSLINWNTPKDEEYSARLARITSRMADRAARAASAAAVKQEIVRKAEELKDSKEWKKTQEAFRNLRDEWKDAGYAGEKDDELWSAFKGFQKEFDANRKDYFEHLDEMREAAAEKKAELIEKAKAATENVRNWKNTGTVMNDLMDQWKAAGSAGRDNDDTLWEQFNGIRKEFFANRSQYFAQRAEELKAAVEAKTSLIEEAKTIVAENSFTKEVTEKMKDLDVRWKAAGYAGPKDNDRLWDEFKEVKEQFWDAKHEDSLKRFQEIIDRKNAQIATLRDEINDLEIKEFETSDFEKISALKRREDEKKSLIETLKNDVAELQAKIESK